MGKQPPGNVQKVMSAGGVVYRYIDNGNIEIVLCGRKDPLRWSLPKGTPDSGETIIQTAIRETQEETGLEVRVEEPLGSIRYWFVSHTSRVRFDKTVFFYLMSYENGETENHDHEFDEVRWFPGEEAVRILHYANDASIVEKALTQVREEPGIG